MLDERDPQNFDPDDSIGDILGRIVTDGRDYAEAEVALAKAKLVSNVTAYKVPVLLLGGAFVFAIGAVISLFWGIAAALATLVGPLAGGALSALLALGIAAILAMVAKGKMEARK